MRDQNKTLFSSSTSSLPHIIFKAPPTPWLTTSVVGIYPQVTRLILTLWQLTSPQYTYHVLPTCSISTCVSNPTTLFLPTQQIQTTPSLPHQLSLCFKNLSRIFKPTPTLLIPCRTCVLSGKRIFISAIVSASHLFLPQLQPSHAFLCTCCARLLHTSTWWITSTPFDFSIYIMVLRVMFWTASLWPSTRKVSSCGKRLPPRITIPHESHKREKQIRANDTHRSTVGLLAHRLLLNWLTQQAFTFLGWITVN